MKYSSAIQIIALRDHCFKILIKSCVYSHLRYGSSYWLSVFRICLCNEMSYSESWISKMVNINGVLYSFIYVKLFSYSFYIEIHFLPINPTAARTPKEAATITESVY